MDVVRVGPKELYRFPSSKGQFPRRAATGRGGGSTGLMDVWEGSDGCADCGVRWLGSVAEAPLRAAVEKQGGAGQGDGGGR